MKKDEDKKKRKTGKNEVSLVRSSAAEYLTFIAAGGNSESSVEMRYEDENVWLTQKMMATGKYGAKWNTTTFRPCVKFP